MRHAVCVVQHAYPTLVIPPPSLVVRASARGARGRGSNPDRATPSQYDSLGNSFLLTSGGIGSVAWHPCRVYMQIVLPKQDIQINSPHERLLSEVGQ